MNISYVAKKLNFDGGGSNFSLELMARTLSKRGHDITVLTLNPDENKYPSNLPFEVIESKPKLGTRFGHLEHTYRTMSEHATSTDLFHVFAPSLLPAAGLFRHRNETTPVVGRLNTYSMFCVNKDQINGTCHQNCTVRAKFAHQDASVQKRIAKIPFYASRTFAEPKLSGMLDSYFAISPAVKQIYTDVGIPTDRILVVPNFYDPDFVSDKPAYSEPSQHKKINILYVGRIKQSKGLDCLIEALSQTDEISATIVGDGSALSDIRDLVDARELTERVTFEGRVPHNTLPQYYQSTDLFIHPARWPEPFGRTLLETMQMNTPALVSDIGGPPWVVGNAGLTFPKDNANILSKILTHLQNCPEELMKLSKNCSSQLERFEPDRVVSSIEHEYTRLIG